MSDASLQRKVFKNSGRINWVHFIPWSAAALLVGALLGLVLFLLFKVGFYLVILIPILASLALGAMVTYCTGKGHCRNRIAAVSLGVLSGVVLYLGYFYFGMVSALGFDYAHRIDLLPNYIEFRMQTDVVKDTHSSSNDAGSSYSFVNWAIFCLEFGLVIVFAAGMAYRKSRKPYCEKCGIWMKRETTVFRPEIGAGLVQALKLRSAQSLAALFSSPAYQDIPNTAVALDFCPSLSDGRSKDCNTFLSVKNVIAQQTGASIDAFETIKGKMLVKGLLLLPDELPAILPRFPVLEKTTGITAALAMERMGIDTAPYAEPPSAVVHVEPVDPLFAGKILTRKTSLICLGFMFALLAAVFVAIGLAWVGAEIGFPDNAPKGSISPAEKIIGQIFIGAGILLFVANGVLLFVAPNFLGARYVRRLLNREFSRRPNPLVNPNDPAARLIQIIPRSNWQKLKLEDATDIGLLAVDVKKREILFEGDKERYRIPGQAITSCEIHSYTVGQGTEGATKLFQVILKANHPKGQWEVPISPRGGNGKLGAKKRERWAIELRAEIESIQNSSSVPQR